MDKITFLVFSGIIGMLLLALAIILFFIVYQRRLIAQQEILRKLELDHHQALLDASISTQEVERQRIAKDLHDSIGASLSTAKLFIHHMQQSDQASFQALKSETNIMLDEAIQNIRNTTRNLLPLTLEQFGFISAISDFCQRCRKYSPINIIINSNIENRSKLGVELALYRIIQELINNTLKHSQAMQIHINFELIENQFLRINYEDNGKGFELEKILMNGEGVGFKSIRSRVSLINGELKLESAPGKGFKCSLQCPFPVP